MSGARDGLGVRLASSVLILSSVIVIGIMAYKAYAGDFNELYSFTPPAFTGGFISQQNPEYPKDMNMIVFLNTTSLSAQNPITVSAKMYPSVDFSKFNPDPWPHLPEYQYLVFPYALKYPLKASAEGDYYSAIIEMKKSDDPRQYYGTGEIVYQFDNKYGFIFIGPKEMQEHVKSDGAVHFTASELDGRVNDMTRFTVGSTELTTSLKTNNIFLSLTLVLLAVGIVEVRRNIVAAVSWIGRRF